MTCRFQDERFNDREMEASWAQIQAEEKRSARLGRREDDEALEDEEAEAARLAAKADGRGEEKPRKKRQRRGVSAFVL